MPACSHLLISFDFKVLRVQSIKYILLLKSYTMIKIIIVL